MITPFETEILGFVAGGLTSLCSVPQVLRIWRSKSAEDISYKMFATLSLGVTLWIVFGFLKKEYSIVITNIVSLVLNLTIIFLKFRFRD